MSEKQLIQLSKLLSNLLSPFYTPMWILTVLFFCSYLKMLPMWYRLFVLFMVFVFTVIIPRMGINMFRTMMRWSHWQLSHREHRHMPYILTIASYTVCIVLLTRMNVVMCVRGVVMAAFVSQIICVFVNAWWKVSTHMVGMGGLVGALVAFGYLFYFNPLWYACGMILLSGLLGTSRMILRQHSLAQVLVGFFIGFVCALIFILLAWM